MNYDFHRNQAYFHKNWLHVLHKRYFYFALLHFFFLNLAHLTKRLFSTDFSEESESFKTAIEDQKEDSLVICTFFLEKKQMFNQFGCLLCGIQTFFISPTSQGIMLTTQDKHNLCCQKVARLLVSLAQGVDL